MLLQLFATSCARFFTLAARSLLPRPGAGAPRWPLQLGVLLVFLPGFALLQLVHWIALALDEILYRDYREVEIRRPVFVVGVPRSGTTFLHRILARDAGTTTLSTWECLLAPSVTERRIIRGAARLDSLVGRPLGRVLRALEKRVFAPLAGIHDMALDDPEEDYLTLLPALASFILILPFPFASIWRLGRFDRDVPPAERERLLAFYESCLKRHLYVHGTDKRILSKNASFPPLVRSLRDRFPDARVFVCLRDPIEVVPSQLSSIESGLRLFGGSASHRAFRDPLVEVLAFYYEHLEGTLTNWASGSYITVEPRDLREQLEAFVSAAYARLGLPMSDQFATIVAQESMRSRGFRSSHRYSLADYGLDGRQIEYRFQAAERLLRAHRRRTDAVRSLHSETAERLPDQLESNPISPPRTSLERPRPQGESICRR